LSCVPTACRVNCLSRNAVCTHRLLISKCLCV
jgi:hypothetical protein